MLKEIFVGIKGYEGSYQLSNYGNIKSNMRKKGFILLKGAIDTQGYKQIKLYKKGRYRVFSVHRLVALYFINSTPKEMINHKDGDKLNNYFKNLEWCTNSENQLHSYNVLKNKAPCGERKVKSSKLTKAQVLEIKKSLGKGKHPKDIRVVYNVSITTIYDIKTKKTWKHISDF